MVSERQTPEARARSELERIGREGDLLAGANAPRPPAEGEAEDRIEVWGRRIGRTLGWAFAIFLAWQLIRSLSG
jgi:hypothetical protein